MNESINTLMLVPPVEEYTWLGITYCDTVSLLNISQINIHLYED